jgi:type III pantothenate kinase
MNLVIDLGNSYAKVGIFVDDKLLQILVTNKNEYNRIYELIPTGNYQLAIVSSVIETPLSFINSLQKICKKVLLFDKSTKIPIKIKYKTPETLGNDRLALAVGGSTLYKSKNILIIDAGSCITYDFVKSNGIYFGGAISPGIEMRFKALNSFTDRLPLIKLENVSKYIGRDTKESILSGVVNGVNSEINSAINYYKTKYISLKIVLTGGDAIFLAKKIKSRIFVEPNFLLLSLNQILLNNV